MTRARFRRGYDRELPLTPGSVERYDIDLWFSSRVFEPGHRIRVAVSSALFPKYDRNLNTGEPASVSAHMLKAEQTIYHDAARASSLVLPVIPR